MGIFARDQRPVQPTLAPDSRTNGEPELDDPDLDPLIDALDNKTSPLVTTEDPMGRKSWYNRDGSFYPSTSTYSYEIVDKGKIGLPFYPHQFATRIKLINRPRIYFVPEVLDSILAVVRNCAQEVSWLGSVAIANENYIIKEIFLVDQKVSAASTEMSEDGIIQLFEQLLKDRGPDVANSIRMWGHSHVGMDTGPSGQDESQMDLFRDNGTDYFIRMIANKKGKIQCSLFLHKVGIEISDIPWSIFYPPREVDDKLWVSEIKKKVKREVYTGYQGRNWKGAGYDY